MMFSTFRNTAVSLGAAAFLAALMPSAQAGLLYEVNAVTFISHIQFEYSFTEPDFLTSTTTIPQVDLTVITSPGCDITSATITDPSSGSPGIGETLAGCGITGTAFVTGPLDAVGSYSNGAPLPTTVTISGTPDSSIPEPASVLLLAAALPVVLVARKRTRFGPDGQPRH